MTSIAPRFDVVPSLFGGLRCSPSGTEIGSVMFYMPVWNMFGLCTSIIDEF